MQQQPRDTLSPFLQAIMNSPSPKLFKSASKMTNAELATKLDSTKDYIGTRHMRDVAVTEDMMTPEERTRAINKANQDQDARFLRLEDMMLEDSLRRSPGCVRWERDDSTFLHVNIVENEDYDYEKEEDTDGREDEQVDHNTTTSSMDEGGAEPLQHHCDYPTIVMPSIGRHVEDAHGH